MNLLPLPDLALRGPTPAAAVAALALAALLAGAASSALAVADGAVAARPGQAFEHQDWELACDNTRTCRAAGYQTDADAERAVSVLLTRAAGPAQAVRGQLMLGDYDHEALYAGLPPVLALTMWVAGRDLGTVQVPQKTLQGELSAAQVAALLAVLPAKGGSVEWTLGKLHWRLSTAGAAAVLLKMDEAQGRLGTRGALWRPGSRGEEAVLPPLPAPVFRAVAPVPARPGDADFARRHEAALRAALRATVPPDDCERLHGRDGVPPPLAVSRLSADRLLVTSPCWLAAYNSGDGAWVVRDAPPFQPQRVTTLVTDVLPGELRAAHKGRGLGDCWSLKVWRWDGRAFVLTEDETTGQCKLLAGGGGWSLPRLQVQLQP